MGRGGKKAGGGWGVGWGGGEEEKELLSSPKDGKSNSAVEAKDAAVWSGVVCEAGCSAGH